MASLEQVVRPSQTTQVRPAYSSSGRTAPAIPDPNEIVFGTAGNDVFALQASSKGEVDNQTSQETSRTFDTVRIRSKDDPNTYIDVEVMTAYQAKNTIDKSRTQLRFEKPQANADTEIVARNQTRKSSEQEG